MALAFVQRASRWRRLRERRCRDRTPAERRRGRASRRRGAKASRCARSSDTASRAQCQEPRRSRRGGARTLARTPRQASPGPRCRPGPPAVPTLRHSSPASSTRPARTRPGRARAAAIASVRSLARGERFHAGPQRRFRDLRLPAMSRTEASRCETRRRSPPIWLIVAFASRSTVGAFRVAAHRVQRRERVDDPGDRRPARGHDRAKLLAARIASSTGVGPSTAAVARQARTS